MRSWGQDPVENVNYRQGKCDRKDEQTLGGCFKSLQQAQYLEIGQTLMYLSQRGLSHVC
jgi:hypothetical protein